MTWRFTTSISVAASDIDANTWHHRLGHMSEKGMKTMLTKGKLPEFKPIDLDFCEDCIYEKQRKVSFSKVKKSLKAKG